jgi:hypothetical protein
MGEIQTNDVVETGRQRKSSEYFVSETLLNICVASVYLRVGFLEKGHPN